MSREEVFEPDYSKRGKLIAVSETADRLASALIHADAETRRAFKDTKIHKLLKSYSGLEDVQDEFFTERLSYFTVLRDTDASPDEQEEARIAYEKSRDGLVQALRNSKRPPKEKEITKVFFTDESVFIDGVGTSKKPLEAHVEVLEQVLASSPLEPFQELLSEQMFGGEAYGVAHLFLRKRTAYFTAYAKRARGNADAPDKRAYEQARKEYNFATQEVVRELRGVKVRKGLDDSWKSELIDAFIVRDIEDLERIGETARDEKRKAMKERIKKMPFMRGALVALAGLAAAQSLDVDTPSVPTYQTTAEGEARTAPPPEVEKVRVFIPSVKAVKGEGVNQMVLNMLEKVKEIHPQALERLQHEDESLIETAERITQESGLWNIETNFNFTVSADDELSYVGGENFGKLLYTSIEHGSFYLTGNEGEPLPPDSNARQ